MTDQATVPEPRGPRGIPAVATVKLREEAFVDAPENSEQRWRCGKCEGGNFAKHSRHCPHRRVADLESALREAIVYIPLGYTDCAGYKCRERHCQACYGDAATPNDERVERLKAVLDAYKQAQGVLPGDAERAIQAVREARGG